LFGFISVGILLFLLPQQCIPVMPVHMPGAFTHDNQGVSISALELPDIACKSSQVEQSDFCSQTVGT
jgi:hypothetical protein